MQSAADTKSTKDKLFKLTYTDDLLPSRELMAAEGITVLEEWFRWAEEWSVLLRVFGKLTSRSNVLEIGCGLGRIAFALRFILSPGGTYAGFEICKYKIDFLKQKFEPVFPNFSFVHADLKNTHYNPNGRMCPDEFSFPYEHRSFDLVYAASVFTHMLPGNVQHYLREAARVLRPGGRCVFSFFLLDLFSHGHPRPPAFAGSSFEFKTAEARFGPGFGFVDAADVERMTAFSLDLLTHFANEAGLQIEASYPGYWSGNAPNWIGAQDLIILTKA